MSRTAAFHKQLHNWYRTYGRKDLPWRNTNDAYAIYVSEIMLQQTQVATVLARYYHPFLKRFPTLKALAAAKQNEVLSAWQGLGYYNRAINLQKAAQATGGTLPHDVDALVQLPGIGRNTAHAIAAFAYQQPVAVMEANVKRVLCRIFALKNPSPDVLWEKAAQLLDTKNPFDYNQAMMDIGATVCARRSPACTQCPASTICAGKSSPESYPAAAKRKKPPVRRKHIVVFSNRSGQYFCRPREGKFLNGLYHFTETAVDSKSVVFSGKPYKLASARAIGHIRQQYSHFTLEAKVHMIETSHNGKDWYSLRQLKTLPFSMAEQKILRLIA